jgi:predicted nucleic acid-binding protein
MSLADHIYKHSRRLPEEAARAALANQGAPIGPYDLQIAAIAMTNDCILVTHYTGEFSRIPGLKLEDWEAGRAGSDI